MIVYSFQMTMDRWLIHCSLLSIKNKWMGKALSVENSAERNVCTGTKCIPPSGDYTGIILYQWPVH